LAGGTGDRREDLRMTAILARRAGLPADAALAAITRHPAEVLGVADRVGSLAPGRDADLLVLSGAPLDINTHVLRVYVNGTVALDAPPATPGVPATQPADPPRPTVVRAGTLWLGNGTIVHDGALLIENGKIAAVGQRVPTPPRARIIDAGADAYVVPGFIDAYGHLGLAGDTTVATPDTAVHRTVARAGPEFQRVARAGVTTVVQAPYRSTNKGARLAAIKTWGRDRTELVARELAGLRFSLRGQDPVGGLEPLRQALQAGRKYDEGWKKHAAELEKWQQGGGAAATRPAEAEAVVTDRPDPLTGTWEYTVRGGPLPEPMNGTIAVRLTGNSVEGRLSDPLSGEEVHVTGTLDGTAVLLEVDVDTPLGRPTIRATLDREDHMTGQVSVGEVALDFTATRTSKAAVEFKIQVRTRRAKDGRPAPPKRDENLEPYRDLLAGRIPAVVEVDSAAQVSAALRLFVDEQKLGLVLLAGPDAADAAELLLARREQCGVVVPREMFVTRARQPYCPAVDLSRRGVRVALQSDSEDAARNLPLLALYAVQQGLGGDAALAALTVDAARMYKLDDRLGSLEPGKDADVLIFRGHPFDAGGRLERVLVGGREVPDAE
jgi:imidazolonepropionase-like amidohydrolase